MARIRSIKPEFFTSDDICALSPRADVVGGEELRLDGADAGHHATAWAMRRASTEEAPLRNATA